MYVPARRRACRAPARSRGRGPLRCSYEYINVKIYAYIYINHILVYIYTYMLNIHICMYRRGEERSALLRVLKAVARYGVHMNK